MKRKPRVYLGGPIHQCTEDQCTLWRRKATRELSLYYLVVDPVDRENDGSRTNKIIVEGDKKDIDACNVLLVNWWKPSCGTAMEILYAWERKKLILTIAGGDQSPWLRYHSTKIFGTLAEATKRLIEIHDSISKVVT